ncbi:MAG: type II 3-dehydroquinate dehydratase [Candidatus Shikimatogenerans sp. AspAUS03]|uniref:3-dehydroquinate dehydratase n=1 Tax=Candidatus Shikimatogenerans sp. AspAUS03 TaxID=3158563 RepID=A0AAU7QUD5_9FLAO
MKFIFIINGPNLNYLGKRENKIYGKINFNYYLNNIKKNIINFKIYYYQTNLENKIINKLFKLNYNKNCIGILLNAGGLSHTSLILLDCIKSINILIIEIHISNIYNRENIRSYSIISKGIKGIIIGLNLKSYLLGIYGIILK